MWKLESRSAWKLRIAIAAVVSCLAAPAIAQESRSDERAQLQNQKPLVPNVPSGGERFFDWIENYVTSPNHWYVTFGNLMPSSGLAPGAGYRGVVGDVARFNLRGAWSVRNYTLAEGVVEVPFADDRFEVAGSRGLARRHPASVLRSGRRLVERPADQLRAADRRPRGPRDLSAVTLVQHRSRRVGHAGRKQRRQGTLCFNRNGVRSEYGPGPAGQPGLSCTRRRRPRSTGANRRATRAAAATTP